MIEKLENNEVTLLMYLAGELPDDDRTEVEQMLATDAMLRQELGALRQLMIDTSGIVARTDQVSAPPVSAGVALRQVSRLMQQAIVEREASRRAEAPAGSQKRMPTWGYVAAGFAVLFIGYTAWWGMHSDVPGTGGGTQFVERVPTLGPVYVDPKDDAVATELIESFESFGELGAEGVDALEAVESELLAMREQTDEDWPGFTAQP